MSRIIKTIRVFALILFVGAIIIFIIAVYVSKDVLRQKRDIARINDIQLINTALKNYYQQYQVYPVSNGECLNQKSSTMQELVETKNVGFVIGDPLWSETSPQVFVHPDNTDIATSSANNFCYWYYADKDKYFLSYYLEGDYRGYKRGINLISGQIRNDELRITN